MSEIVDCDIAIIGGGTGGLVLAAGAVQMGANVVLIENKKMGGDCLNYGSIPSKSLLAAAKLAWQIKNADCFGISVTEMNINFKKVMQRVIQVIHTVAEHDSIEHFEKLGVRVIQASGSFVDPDTVQAGDLHIKAKRFVIATGSSAFIPPINGLDRIIYYTNETIFSLTEQPKHLIVIGGGPIGCELAQAFAMLGSQVTLIESQKILPRDEADCVDIIRKKLQDMGISIYEGATVQQLMQEDHTIRVIAKEQEKTLEIHGSHILIAAGRRPNVQNLNLEKANIVYSDKGIEVDNKLCSSNKKVYVIGDAAGGFQFTHIANYHASVVLKNILLRLPTKVDYKNVPWVIYTEPELAHIGLLTEEIKKEHPHAKILESAFTDNDRAQTDHQTLGKIKLIIDKDNEILGVTIVGHNAGELLLPWIMAIREGKSLRSFTDAIVPYPTFSEISKRVAREFYVPLVFSDKVRWVVKKLLTLG